MSTRLCPASATNSWLPDDASAEGRIRTLALAASRASEKLVWPMTTSAAVPLAEGKLDQSSSRLLPRSATMIRVPSLQTSDGSDSVEADRKPTLPLRSESLAAHFVRLFWPSTRSAAAPLAAGKVFQISTRLLPRSATSSFPPAMKALAGERSRFAAQPCDGMAAEG